VQWPHPIEPELQNLMIGQALGEIAEKQSSWRPAELVRELAAVLPTDTADTAGRVIDWVDQLAERVAVPLCVDISKPVPPDAMLRRDGRPVIEAATDRALTTQAILDEKELADRLDGPPSRPRVNRVLSGDRTGPDRVEPGAGRSGR
jgi:hypothetical protein